MNGVVDELGRAVITVNIAEEEFASPSPVDVWIDTGFTGDLLLPQHVIDQKAFGPVSSVEAILADGSQVLVPRYSCWIDWFGERRQLEVIATDVAFPLLGVGLLVGHELTISYSTMTVDIE